MVRDRGHGAVRVGPGGHDDQVGAVSPTGRRDFPALTGLRIVAALWVVLFHASGALSGVFQAQLQPLWPVLHAGWLGVDLFFVLSGFVIVNAYLSTLGPRLAVRPVARFLWARFARVWPVWALVTGLYMAFLVVTGNTDQSGSGVAPVTFWNTVEQLLMVQLWRSPGIDNTSYVVPGWSLSAEVLAYVCFPMAALLLFRLRRLPAVVLASLSVLALVPSAYLTYHLGDDTDRWQLRIAGGFLAGVLMGMAVARIRATPQVERIAARVAVAAVLELVIVCWWASTLQPISYSGVAVLTFPILVGSLALTRSGMAGPLSTPLMQLGGRISYSLYLLHSCVLIVFETAAHHVDRLAPGSRLYAFLLPQLIIGTVLASYLLWRFVEEPSRRWLMAHGPGARPAPAPALVDARATGLPTGSTTGSTSEAPSALSRPAGRRPVAPESLLRTHESAAVPNPRRQPTEVG